jgi:hypothetical protein
MDHTQPLLQGTGQRIHPRPQPAIGQRLATEDDGGFVGVALRGHVQKVRQRDLRHPQAVRHSARPEAVVQGCRSSHGSAQRLREISSFMTSLVPP